LFSSVSCAIIIPEVAKSIINRPIVRFMIKSFIVLISLQ
jgi:hypothetical protein